MTNSPLNPPPLIVAFVGDLMFTSRIEAVIRHLGYRVEWIEQAADLGDATEAARPESPGERLYGRDGLLFDKITSWHPALLLFDLTNANVPWQTWIPLLKASAATRRIPIMCFGPHEDVALMQHAKDLGAEAVLARSRFTADMPALFERYSRIPDESAIRDACLEPLSPLAHEGIELFNAGNYYRCHDQLEAAWMNDQGPGRDLYRGILQVGIAYYQIERQNYRGAVKMLLRVRQWLEPLSPICRGIDVAKLRSDIDHVYEALASAGPENVSAFDLELFQPIRYVE